MATIDIKYLTQPHDGTPGTSWDDFEERILSVAAGKTDDRGWSLADTFNGVDEGAAGGPPVPGGAAGAKASAARRRRLKDGYSLLYTHQLDADIRSELTQNHFQDGAAAWAYLIGPAGLRTPATRMQLLQYDKEWKDIDIVTDIGVNSNTIQQLASRLARISDRNNGSLSSSYGRTAVALRKMWSAEARGYIHRPLAL